MEDTEMKPTKTRKTSRSRKRTEAIVTHLAIVDSDIDLHELSEHLDEIGFSHETRHCKDLACVGLHSLVINISKANQRVRDELFYILGGFGAHIIALDSDGDSLGEIGGCPHGGETETTQPPKDAKVEIN